MEKIAQVLREAGKACEALTTADGSRLLLLPYGARVLGLYAADSPENFFWTNPAFERAETARALFAGDGWHNTGGDRTWIAPELDVFFTDAAHKHYWQPRQLDMSAYEFDRTGGGCRFTREMALALARSGRQVRVRLTKWFGPAAHPLRRERDMADAATAVQFAGYTQRVALQSLDEPFQSDALLGIWNLIQLPEGGEMVAPTYWRAAPQTCFGNVPADHLAVEEHVVRFNTDLRGSHKVAIKAAVSCGRIGYFFGRGAERSLVIRNFFLNPSGEYVDVQPHDTEDFGYAVQLCRIDEAAFGSFCELEYHAPALGALPDPARSEDVSQVWAFRGPRDAIDAIAQKLLGLVCAVPTGRSLIAKGRTPGNGGEPVLLALEGRP